MLPFQQSASRDLVLLIAGPTTGTIAVRMGSLAAAMLTNALANLASLGLHNTLALSTHLHLADSAHPAYRNNNVCLSELRPRGVCCGYSGVGMRLVNAPGSPGRKWGLSETHPYMLFLQRWWLAGQASIRGYNLLSLDTDLHLTVHPLRLLRSPPYAPFQLMLQLDSGWPSEADEEGLDTFAFEDLVRERLKLVQMDPAFLERSVNEGFSGGEKKRNEILQMALLEPLVAILDETDSGLDIDALRIVAGGVCQLAGPDNATLLITHYQRLLDLITPDYVHVMAAGRILRTGGKELAVELERSGYDWVDQEVA